ncbi:MAG: XRE family transcriptional regulator [Bradyrhizobiaceae bacterium]|nr:XRE family transcriptional regulator [Bradyrhizobiaceae bacterium]
MEVRSGLMTAIKDEVRSWKVTQCETARRLGITQPRLNDLLRGKISKFLLDALAALAPHANLGRVSSQKRDSAAIAIERAEAKPEPRVAKSLEGTLKPLTRRQG